MDNGASSYRRFLDGEKEAFDEIVKEYRAGLILFINTIVQELAASEDIAIDVFVDVLTGKYKYNFSTSMKTFLYMMGRSRALNYIKRRDRYRQVDITEMEEQLADGRLLEEELLLDERRRQVREALEEIPKDMREAVYLVFFEDLSYEDAAKVMKKNKKQVDNLLYRAKKELRTILERKGANAV